MKQSGWWVLTLAAIAVSARGQATPTQTKPTQPAQQPAAEDLINPDRPGIADGSNVVGKHHFQIEVGAQWERHDSGSTQDRRFFIPSLLRLGLSDKWELRSETIGAFAWAQVAGQTTSGYLPLSIGAKYHFQDGNGIQHPSLGIIGRVFPASGSSSFASTKSQEDLRLAADWDLLPGGLISLNPNVGVGSYQGSGGQLFTVGLYALTINYNPTSHLNFFLDGGMQAPEDAGGKTALIIDIGTAVIVGSNVQLDFSVGTGVQGVTTPHPFIGAGFSRRF